MMISFDNLPPHRTPSMVICGHSKSLLFAAMIFRQLDWNVGIVCNKEYQVEARGALGDFPSEGIIAITATPDRIPFSPDIVVRPAGEESPGCLIGPATTEIELVGARYDDKLRESWTSCSELIAYMRSGFGVLTRQRDEDGIHGLPCLTAGHLSSFFLSANAVMLGCAALLSPSRPRLISVSAQECLLATLHNAVGFAQLEGKDIARVGEPVGAGGRFECKDGHVLMRLPATHQWEKLVAILGYPNWSKEDWWRQPQTRDEHGAVIAESIAGWCAERTREEVFTALQDAGIPAGYLASAEDIFKNRQIAAREFFTSKKAGLYPCNRAFRVEAAAGPEIPIDNKDSRPAPTRRPSSRDLYLPLAGLRVCDLSWIWAGPISTERLAMLGASVVKVESRDRIDSHRLVPPHVKGEGELYDRGVAHLVSGRGKQSIDVNFKLPEGLQVVKDLIARSDILFSNFTPGTLDRMGLGFDVVSELVGRRAFICVELSGFGATGPWRNYRSYGAQIGDLSGLSGFTGTPETGPLSMGTAFGDPVGGTFGAALVLNYWRESQALKTPLRIEISQFEVLISGLYDALVEGRPTGNWRRGDLPGTGVYPCREPDTWIAVSVTTEAQAKSLAEAIGADVPEYDRSGAMESRLAAWATALSCGEAATVLRSNGLDCTEVLSPAELLNDKSLIASGYWVRSSEGIALPTAPWTVDGERAAFLGLAPRVGEHTEVVARDILGYSEERIRALKKSGALT